MKIFFMLADNVSGCAHYRMFLPFKYIKKYHDSVCKVVDDLDDPDLNKADMIIVQRQHDRDIKQFLKKKKKEGKIIVFEIDDNMWRLPIKHKAREYWTKDRLEDMQSIISLSHAVITSTEPLADFLGRFNKNVYVMPNYIERMIASCNKEDSDTVKIGFSGSDTHALDFTPDIIQAILDIKEQCRDEVEFHFLGYVPEPLIGKVAYYHWVESSKYFDILANLNLDIGIAPCVVNEFNNHKSDVKFVEYSAVGALTIASPVTPYQNISDVGIVLPDNKYQTWLSRLKLAIEENEHRNAGAKQAWNYVKENRLIKNNIGSINEVYLKIAEQGGK